MPNWLDISSASQLLSPSVLIAALLYLAVFAVLLVYFDSFCRALEPRAGTLEWIYQYDRPTFSFSEKVHRLTRSDIVPLLLVSAAAVGLAAYAVVLYLHLSSPNWQSVLICPDALVVGIAGSAMATALTLIPCWLLLHSLFGKPGLACVGTAVFAFNLTMSSSAPSLSTALLLLSAVCFLRWMCGSCDASFGRTLLPLLGWLLCFWLAVWCEHTTLWFGTGYAVLFPAALIGRCRERHERGAVRHLIATLLLTVIFTAVFAALRYLPTALIAHGMTFPQLITAPSFWRGVLNNTITFDILIDAYGLLSASLLNQPLWWGGALAGLLCCLCIFSRRDASALFCALFYLAGMLIWVFAGSGIGAAASTAALCYIWNGFIDRDQPIRAWGYAAVCIAVSLAMLVMLLFF